MSPSSTRNSRIGPLLNVATVLVMEASEAMLIVRRTGTARMAAGATIEELEVIATATLTLLLQMLEAQFNLLLVLEVLLVPILTLPTTHSKESLIHMLPTVDIKLHVILSSSESNADFPSTLNTTSSTWLNNRPPRHLHHPQAKLRLELRLELRQEPLPEMATMLSLLLPDCDYIDRA